MSFTHHAAAILSIGDEISLGQSLDTNSKWIADRLLQLGVTTVEHVTIGDDQPLTAETIRRLASRVDLIVSTGGLGPTLDDLTRQALADVLGEALVLDEPSLHAIETRFAARGRVMSEIQRIQATRPASARMLANPNGTAPGLHAVVSVEAQANTGEANRAGIAPAAEEPWSVVRLERRRLCDVYCLPGPPGEMKPMFEAQIAPSIRLEPGRHVATRFIHLAGIGEGDAAAKLGELMDRRRVPLVGITASGGVLTCRVRYEGSHSASDVDRMMNETDRLIRGALGLHVFGDGDETVVSAVLNELRARGEALACVESCTGGLVSQMVTDVPGSSDVFLGGIVTYSNEVKTGFADVPRDLIAAHGAVSEPVARAMALGGARRTGATRCLSITGIAGPAGGSDEKPVGTVHIALASIAGGVPHVLSRRFLFTGSRHDIRNRSAMTALVMLLFAMRGSLDDMALLWEHTGQVSGAKRLS